MPYQKLLKQSIVDSLKKNIDISKYATDVYEFRDSDILINSELEVSDGVILQSPVKKTNYDFENAVTLYTAYSKMTPLQATDVRIWTYLTHVTFIDYMKKRRPVEDQPKEKQKSFILQHYFIDALNSSNMLRHDIALLWWSVHMTYDKTLSDPFKLTRELFSMADYTRSLLPSSQGHNKVFVAALLEYVSDNKNIFEKYKESKVRFIMRKLNLIGGYKNFSSLTKDEIINIIRQYRKQIEAITD